tara:strand:+ start:2207 stop:2767 length:561 start_codon:yes stop_codon:yes gene_type:complete
MVPNKKWIVNGIFILAVLVLVFTPVGFYIKVYVNRILAFNPTPVEAREQQLITDYHWKLQDLESNGFNFEKVKGKVVFINFWASWCPPCVAEMPSLQSLYNDYGDNVIFMFVAQDQQKRVERFLKKGDYKLPVYYEKTTTPKQLFSKSIPSTYIISKAGKIVVAKTGAADWNSNKTRALIDDLLSQ